MIKALRGMKDLHDESSAKFNYIIQTASKIARN